MNSDGSVDTNAVKNWFGHQGLGTSNAGGMASTFIMIAKKELPERGGDDSKRTSAERKGTKRKAPEPKEVSASVDDSVESGVDSRSGAREDISSRRGADIHLDIQIHIPANASAEQIDQIFASMSKHLYD
ncbi:MAG: hypothetical protein ACREMY_04585, partial [bacterium]